MQLLHGYYGPFIVGLCFHCILFIVCLHCIIPYLLYVFIVFRDSSSSYTHTALVLVLGIIFIAL